MANYTPNLNLRKPLTTEKYDMVADLNDTKDKIDNHAGAVNAQLAQTETIVNAKSFGAVGNANHYNVVDGKYYSEESFSDLAHDDTQAIKEAISYAIARGHRKMKIPSGNYLVVAKSGANHLYNLPSGFTLEMDNDTHIKLEKNTLTAYSLFRVEDVENVTIRGGNLDGDKDIHADPTSEYGHGLVITGAKNVVVENFTSNNMRGDGIVVTGLSENIKLTNVRCDNNRRNNLTIAGVSGFRADNCEFSNAKGTNPQSGVDIEPTSNEVEDIVFNGCVAFGNAESGFLVSSGSKNATFTNCFSHNNGLSGFETTSYNESFFASSIVFSNCVAHSNTYGIASRIRSKDIRIENCKTYENRTGIFIQSSENVNVFNSESTENEEHGIFSNQSTDVRITGCVSQNNLGSGIIFLTGSIRPIIVNNLVSDNMMGVDFSRNGNIVLALSISEATITNNTVKTLNPLSNCLNGILIEGANVTGGYLKDNDCYKGGTSRGILIYQSDITNAGNRNKDGTFSETAS